MKLEPGDTVDTGLDAAVHTSEQVEQAELIDRRQEGFSSVRVNISKKEVGFIWIPACVTILELQTIHWFSQSWRRPLIDYV